MSQGRASEQVSWVCKDNASGPISGDHPVRYFSSLLMLQVRVRVIDGRLRDDFARWYPGFPSNASAISQAA